MGRILKRRRSNPDASENIEPASVGLKPVGMKTRKAGAENRFTESLKTKAESRSATKTKKPLSVVKTNVLSSDAEEICLRSDPLKPRSIMTVAETDDPASATKAKAPHSAAKIRMAPSATQEGSPGSKTRKTSPAPKNNVASVASNPISTRPQLAGTDTTSSETETPRSSTKLVVSAVKTKSSQADKSNATSPAAKAPSLFSLFKKPLTPRRSSNDNKIFVSGATDNSPLSNKAPVYASKTVTPRRRKSNVPPEETEHLYDFEVDENEPKAKKRHRPIMKIQRLRAGKKLKPKRAFVSDPEADKKLLRDFDLSPSVLEAKKPVLAGPSKPPNPPVAVTPAPVVSNSEEVQSDDDHFEAAQPSPEQTPLTPVRVFSRAQRVSQLNESLVRFGVAPTKSSSSPIPIIGNLSHSSPASVRSVAAEGSIDEDSIYDNQLNLSSSTPIKFNNNNSTISEPADLNVSNCFGFDDEDVIEEPLQSPIVRKGHVPRQPRPQAVLPTTRRPLNPTVDVGKVIQQLKLEVGGTSTASANLSVFDDSAISPRKRSPIKRFLKPEGVDESTKYINDDDGNLEYPIAVKVPRLSYERPKRKRAAEKIFDTLISHMSDNESHDSEDEEEPEPKAKAKGSPKKKFSPKKKDRGMTKKEADEFEKWAKQFNSQCDQVEQFGLCVE